MSAQVPSDKSRRRYSRTFGFFAATALVLTSITSVFTAEPAHANPTSGFDAGNIIADDLFYDGDAMTASQVQSFLNQQVSSPTSSSLRNYTTSTTSKTSDRYCNSYAGKSSETAAEIIQKLGKACGVSQKALLVILQKETSLITLRSPESWRYDRAMGYACPDTGPGGSANCDTSYYGFFNQVYHGARQLKRYGIDAGFNWFPVGQTTNIQYHPDTSCGTKSVRIANEATAALYYYTPYTPNAAALNAGWGTGNSCSSYGNRNFYAFYTSWFGSTQIQVTGAIKKEYDRDPDSYGKPLANQKRITKNGGGYEQQFEKGIITNSNALDLARGVGGNGSFYKEYADQGGAAGNWGFVKSRVYGEASNGDRRQHFQHGTATYTSEHGVILVPTRLHDAWEYFGRHTGELGLPIAKASLPTATSGTQRFENGVLMVSGSSRTIVTYPQLDEWYALGSYGKLGLYTSDVHSHDGGKSRAAENGTVYFSDEDETIFLANGQFLDEYDAAGGPDGGWGWIVSGKVLGSDGTSTVRFENGTATHRPGHGVTFEEMRASSITITP